MTEQRACTLCGAGGHTAAQCNWSKSQELHPDMKRVYDVIGLHYSQPVHVLVTCFENTKRFSDLLHAVEREFFMVPGEPSDEPEDEGCEPDDVCLVSSWGSTQEQYIEQFREALTVIQARAALAQPSPAPELDDQAFDRNAERLTVEAFGSGGGINPNATSIDDLFLDESAAPELERPEVVGYCDPNHIQRMRDDQITGFMVHEEKGVYTCEPLMTVAQHDRIVGALRAEIASMKRGIAIEAQEKSEALSEIRELRDELDAAQARVAELERSETALSECCARLQDKVAQAGQVPEGFALVPLEPTAEMREAFHDSYERYEDGEHECPDDQWKAMIAAAPAQGGE